MVASSTTKSIKYLYVLFTSFFAVACCLFQLSSAFAIPKPPFTQSQGSKVSISINNRLTKEDENINTYKRQRRLVTRTLSCCFPTKNADGTTTTTTTLYLFNIKQKEQEQSVENSTETSSITSDIEISLDTTNSNDISQPQKPPPPIKEQNDNTSTKYGKQKITKQSPLFRKVTYNSDDDNDTTEEEKEIINGELPPLNGSNNGKQMAVNGVEGVDDRKEENNTKEEEEVVEINNDDDDDIDEPYLPSNSIGSFLLQRKREEEAEIQSRKRMKSKKDKDGKGVIDDEIVISEGGETEEIVKSKEKSKIRRKKRIGVEIIDETDKSGVKIEQNKTVIEDEENTDKIEPSDEKVEEAKVISDSVIDEEEDKMTIADIDENLAREVDDAIISLETGEEDNELLKDINVIMTAQEVIGLGSGDELSQSMLDNTKRDPLPLSDIRHVERISLDIQQLAVSISSTVDDASQWNSFCEDGGGLLPLLECIRKGAQGIRSRNDIDEEEELLGFLKLQEESFATACRACKTLRDLCSISTPFATIVTDGILRADTAWSTALKDEKTGKTYYSGGLISDLVTIIHYAGEADQLYSSRAKKLFRKLRRRGMNVTQLGSRRQRRDARKRCALYVLQLLLEMAFASDAAVNGFRQTEGFTETVLSCSSYAQAERLRRRWIRYPIEVIKRKLPFDRANSEEKQEAFLAAAKIGGLTGQIQGAANQVLASIGYNVWYPKRAGQKGLRILCLDGGGTRGITAISSMRALVDAMGGVEVCDAFDIIAGTSTGAIIAFLVGLRRESSVLARKRYDQLIKRIFVKSALSTPMLVFTTATYDESHFNNVMSEVLQDDGMLASRADPRVPLVFAVSSKMSSTPTQLCLFRNYNYSGGEKLDAFVQDPEDAREELGLESEDDIMRSVSDWKDGSIASAKCSPRRGKASRHSGSFRLLQRAALRATTAAPTVFKPVLIANELYCDGGIVASNPAAIAIHEARAVFPDVPIELVVSCGTGAFVEEKTAPRIGWDGIIGQIVNSATDGEQIHHILEDILGQGGTARLGFSSVSKTKYYRFNPVIGKSDTFPIDGTDPEKLEELSQITFDYMKKPEEAQKVNEICEILRGKQGWKRFIPWV